MNLGFAQLYSNGLNSTSQIRRSVDMLYQRGGTYEIILTGDTYIPSIELDIDMYSSDAIVGRMALVPYEFSQSGSTYFYKFNFRPYSYLASFAETQHYQYYWINNFDKSNEVINFNNPYPNVIKANFKYSWRYVIGNVTYKESDTPIHDLNHFTHIPETLEETVFNPSGFTSTGKYFDYIGGSFQMDDNFFLPNNDQEIGTIIGTGFTIDSLYLNKRVSPISYYMMDYPTLPEQSETARFLTDAPRVQYIQDEENYVLYYLNGQSGDRQFIEADYAVFEFFDSNNNMLNWKHVHLNKPGTPYQSATDNTDNLKIFALPCGPKDITNLYDNYDYNTVAYYTVQLCYSFPNGNSNRTNLGPMGPLSEVFYFYLYNNCLPESTRLCWLNSKGTYDYYTFQSYRQDTSNIERQTYDSRYYSPSLLSADRNIGRSVKTFDTNVNQQIELESNYLTVPMSNWIQELFLSPQVYIMRSDYISPIDRQNKVYKDLRPVHILSTTVDTFTKKHQKLNKYKITLQTSDSYFVNKGF
jgi:hypothetical protein